MAISFNMLLAQKVIKGRILDINEQPLPLINVLLLAPGDSTLVKGALSGDDGEFNISGVPDTSYELKLVFLGYASLIKHIPQGASIALGDIVMEEEALLLNAVVIKEQKPLYEQKKDRLIVNVMNNISTAGGNGLDVLERSPGIFVDRGMGNLQLNGRDGVIILINGKATRQSMNTVMQMLEGMSADNIESIEIFSNPPAQYEARGGGGLIDIKLKRNKNEGLFGSGSVSLGYGKYAKEGMTFNISNSGNKISWNTDHAVMRNKSEEIWISELTTLTESGLIEMNTRSLRVPVLTTYSGNVGLDYTINSKFRVGAGISLYIRDWVMEAVNTGFEKSSVNPISYFYTENEELNRFVNPMVNTSIFYQVSPGTSAEVNVDYIHSVQNNPSTYNFYIMDSANQAMEDRNILAEKYTPIDALVAKTHFVSSLNDKVKVEYGIQGTFSTFENSVEIKEKTVDEFLVNDEFGEKSELKERILAAYSSMDYTINEKTSLSIGLRYENYRIRLNSRVNETANNQEYQNLFPTLYLMRTLKEGSSIIFSFGRRITRPDFEDLAPFVYFLDPRTFFYGNTALKPAFVNNYKLDYSLKGTFFSLQYSNENNSIVRYQPIFQENGDLIYTSLNLDSQKILSLTISTSFKVTDWWTANFSIFDSQRWIYGGDGSSVIYNLFQIKGTQTFKLSDKTTIELTSDVYTKQKGLYAERPGRGNLNIALQQKIARRGKLNLSFISIFRSDFEVYSRGMLIPEAKSYINYSYRPRILRITYQYTFGGGKQAEKGRNTNADEIKSRIHIQ